MEHKVLTVHMSFKEKVYYVMINQINKIYIILLMKMEVLNILVKQHL